MALAANKVRRFEIGDINEVPVAASTRIYEGSAVGLNASTGYARPLNGADAFLGFAETEANNSTGAAGDKMVRIKYRGSVRADISGLAITDVGKAVYMSDDDVFTLTQGSNSHVGRIQRFVSSGVGIVSFDASGGGSGTFTELTDSTGGTADNTVADVGAAFSQATLNNNFADLSAKVNAILRVLR